MVPPALSQLPAKPAPWPDTDAAAAKAGADAAAAGEDVEDGGDAAGGGGEVSSGTGWTGSRGLRDWVQPGSPSQHLSCLPRVLPPPPQIHLKV